MIKTKILKSVIAVILLLSLGFTTVFGDIAVNDYEDHWAKETIQKWVDTNSINGYMDGTFKPDKTMTRAEFIAIVNKVFQLTEKAEIQFTDVKPDSWYYEDVQKAVAKGYIKGVSNILFDPDNEVTKEQMVVMTVRLSGLEPAPEEAKKLSDFADLSDWAIGDIGAALKAGLIDVSEDNSFKPQNPITRAEAVVILDNEITKLDLDSAINPKQEIVPETKPEVKPDPKPEPEPEPEPDPGPNPESEERFKDALRPINKKEYPSEKFTAVPLIILMDFPDYKYTDLDKNELIQNRINEFKGSETTPEFYEELFFGDDFYTTSNGAKNITVNKFYMEESGGTYSLDGEIYGWYTAQKNIAYYGQNPNDQARSAELTREAIQAFIKANPNADLSKYDIEDKWDIDNDGDYNEPDGIIDTVVVLHAGIGEEWGGGVVGSNAIWPFRIGFSWYTHALDLDNPLEAKKLKEKDGSGIYPAYRFEHNGEEWFAEDFSVFEQDLPLDLFCHEYGHVLGLPDLYASEGTPPVENWSLMGGSYTGDPKGSKPNAYGAVNKKMLQEDFEKRGRAYANWQNSYTLDLDEIGSGIDVVLDQESLKGTNKDSVIVNLPSSKGKRVVKPFGETAYFSDNKDNLENYMYLSDVNEGVLLDANNPKLSFKAWYDIDPYFDFFTVQIREKGQEKWDSIKDETGYTTDKVAGYVQSNETPEQILDRNPGWSLTDTSYGDWVDVSFDLSEYKGKEIELRFRYRSDGNTPERGVYVDNIEIKDGENILLSDGSEDPEFSLNDFLISDGYEEEKSQYYIMEWRSSGAGALVDEGLLCINQAIPALTYDPGLILWYINDRYAGSKPDQENAGRNGEQWAGVVDADQNPIMYDYPHQENEDYHGADKVNYQLRDAAFSIRLGSEMVVEGNKFDPAWNYTISDKNRFMNTVFDDSNNYMQSESYADGVECGVNIPNYGLKIFVTDESYNRSTAKIHIGIEGSSSVQEQSIVQQILFVEDEINIITDKEYSAKAYAELVADNGETIEAEFDLIDGMYKFKSDLLINGNNWQISFLVLEDKEGNAKAIYNSNVHNVYGFDFNDITSKKAIAELGGIAVNSKTYDKEPISMQGEIYALDTATGERIAIEKYDYAWLDEAGNKLEAAPINAGSYKLKVVTVDEKYFGIANISFVIEKRDVIIKAKDINIDLNAALPTIFELEYSNVLAGDEKLLVNKLPEYQLQKSDDTAVADSSLAGQYYIQITNLNDIILDNANYNIRTEFGYGLLLIGDVNYPLNVEVSGISIVGKRLKEYDKKSIIYSGEPIAKIGKKQINVKEINVWWSEKADSENKPLDASPTDAGEYVLNIRVEDEKYTGGSTLTAAITPREVGLWIYDYGINQGDVLPNDKALEIYFKNIIEGDEKLLLNPSCQPRFYFTDNNWDVMLSSVRAGKYTIRLKNPKELLVPNKNYEVSEQSGILDVYGDNTKLDEREQVEILGVEIDSYIMYSGEPVKYKGEPYAELNGKKLDLELQIVWYNKTTHDILTSAPSDRGEHELIILVPEDDSKYVGRIKKSFSINPLGIQVEIKDKTIVQGSKLPSKFNYDYRDESTNEHFYDSSILKTGTPEFKVYEKLENGLGKQISDTTVPGEYYVRIANFNELVFDPNYNTRMPEDHSSWGTLTIKVNSGEPVLPDIDEDKTEVQINGITAPDKVYDKNAYEVTGSITAKDKISGEDVTTSVAEFEITYRVAGEELLSREMPTDAGSYELVIYVPESDETYTGNVIIPFKITPKPLNLLIENKDGKDVITQGDPLPASFDLSYEATDENVPTIEELPLGVAAFEIRAKLTDGNLGEPIKETYSAQPGEYAVVISNFETIKPTNKNYTVTTSQGSLTIKKSDKIFVKVEGVAIGQGKTYDGKVIELSANDPKVLLRADDSEIDKNVKLIYTWVNSTTGIETKGEITTGDVITGDVNAPKDAGKYKLTVYLDDSEYAGNSEEIEFTITPIQLELESKSFTFNEDSELPMISELIKFTNVMSGDEVKIAGDSTIRFKNRYSDGIIESIDDLIADYNESYLYYRVYINKLGSESDAKATYMTLKSTNSNYEIPSTDGGKMFDIIFTMLIKKEVEITGIDIDGITDEGKITYNGNQVNYVENNFKILDDEGEDVTDQISCEYKWYKLDGENETPLSEAPKDTGSYKLELSVPKNNETYKGSWSKAFEIVPKELKIIPIYGDSAIIEILNNRLPWISEIIKLDAYDICAGDSVEIKDSNIEIKLKINEEYENAGSIIETVDEIVKDKALHYTLCANDADDPMTIESTNPNYVIPKISLKIGFKEKIVRQDVTIEGITIDGINQETSSKGYDKTPASYIGTPVVKLSETGANVDNVDTDDIVYKWYEQADAENRTPLNSAPVDAGSYKLVISISQSNEEYSGETVVNFTIIPKVLTVESVNADFIFEKGDVFPKISEIITLEGVCLNDIVGIENDRAVKLTDEEGTEITSMDDIVSDKTLRYILSANDPDDETDEVIESTDPNYEIPKIFLKIGFKPIRQKVVIKGITVEGISQETLSKEYDKISVSYTGTPIVKLEGKEEAVTISDLDYDWYEQKDEKNDNPLKSAPVNAGSYKLVVSVPKSNDYYNGACTIEFSIEPKKLELEGESFYFDEDSELPMISELIKFTNVLDGDNVKIAEDFTVQLKRKAPNASGMIESIADLIADIEAAGGSGANYRIYVNRLDTTDDGNDVTLKSSNPNYEIPSLERGTMFDIWFAKANKEKLRITGVTVEGKQYDMQPAEYDKSGLKVLDSEDREKNLADEIDYRWYNKDGTLLDNAPIDAGEYYLIVSISKNNIYYKGSSDKIGFIISPRAAKVKPWIEPVENRTEIPDEINLLYSGIFDADRENLITSLSIPAGELIISYDNLDGRSTSASAITAKIVFDNSDGRSTSSSAITAKIVISDKSKDKIKDCVNSNYIISFEDGVLIVKNGAEVPEKPEATIEFSGSIDKTYDGKKVTYNSLKTVINDKNGVDITDEIFELKYTWKDEAGNTLTEAPTDAGDYKLTVSTSAESDYVGSETISFTISKKKVKLSLYGSDDGNYTVYVNKGDPMPEFELCLLDSDGKIISGIEILGTPVFEVYANGKLIENTDDPNIEYTNGINDCSVKLTNKDGISITGKNYELDTNASFNGYLRISE